MPAKHTKDHESFIPAHQNHGRQPRSALNPKIHLLKSYYFVIIALAIVATTLGGYFSSNLTLESDLAKLLPHDYESVKTLERIKEEVGGVGNIRIVVESKDFQKSKAFADALAAKLDQSQNVNYVDYRNDIAFYKRNALLYLEEEELDSLKQAIEDKVAEEKQKLNPLFVEDLFADDEVAQPADLDKWQEKYQAKEPREYLTNADSSALVLDVYPAGSNTSLNFVRQILAECKQIVTEVNPQSYATDMQIYYGGSFKNRLDEYEVVKKDIVDTAYYGLIGVFVLILLYFRHLLATLLVSLVLIMSLTWTFGVTYLVIGNLNTITGFLFIILFGLGIDYGIHAMSRYRESRRAGLNVDESLRVLVGPTARAMLTSAFTSLAAFYTLTIMDFKGFSEMGFISGTGILFALIAMTVVLPAFIILAEKFNMLNFKQAKQRHRKIQDRKFPLVRGVLTLSLFLTLFSIFSLFRVEFEFDFTNLRAQVPERQLIGEKTAGVFELSESPAIVLGNSKEDVDEIVSAVREIIKNDRLSPTVNTVRSVYSLVPENQERKLKAIAEIRRIVEEETEGILKGEDKERVEKLKGYLQVRQPFTLQEVPDNLKRQFINKQGAIGNFAFIYASVALRDGKNAIDFRNDIGEITTASGKKYYASSSNIIFADMLSIMLREGRVAVVLTFVVVLLIVFLDFRNVRETLLVLTPLLIGVLWMIGAMVLFGMKLNFFNIVVLPSIIGLGEDHGVHIYHRYKEEGRGSLWHVLRHTGLAISMCAATTLVGYSGLITANHPGLNSIGKLAIIGITATFVTAVVVLPAMLQFLEKRKK